MRIAGCSTQTREVLSATDDVLRRDTGEKLASVVDHVGCSRARCAGSKHLGRLGQCEIDHRGERRIEAECLHCTGNQLAVFAGEGGLSGVARGGGHSLSGSDGRQSIAEPVYRSTLYVNAANSVTSAKPSGLVQQRTSLLDVNNVAAKQDDAAGTHQLEPSAFQRGQFRSRQSHDQETAGRFSQCCCTCHQVTCSALVEYLRRYFQFSSVLVAILRADSEPAVA